jgi:hypothetical protein
VLRCRPLLEIADHFFTSADIQLRDNEQEWRSVADAIGVDARRLLLIHQVHGAAVAVARAGRHAEWGRPEADVLVSDDPSSAIGVRVADCAPILIADRRTRVVAASHAGWRGTVQRAGPAAVEALQREFGSDPQDLVAAIGPCLGACCGEVGEEVVAAFRQAGHAADAVGRWFGPGSTSRPYLDLARANADQLIAAGVAPESVHISGLCTRTHSGLLHSYRAQGHAAGRMGGVIRGGIPNR